MSSLGASGIRRDQVSSHEPLMASRRRLTNSNDVSIRFEELCISFVEFAVPGHPRRIKLCDFCKERSWKVTKRMEEDAIYDDAGEERREVAERYNSGRKETLQSA